MTLTITEADRHPGMYAISDSALLPVEEQVFFSGYFGKHGPWVYVAGPQLLEALKELYIDLVANDEDGLIEHVEPMRKAAAAIALAKGEVK